MLTNDWTDHQSDTSRQSNAFFHGNLIIVIITTDRDAVSRPPLPGWIYKDIHLNYVRKSNNDSAYYITFDICFSIHRERVMHGNKIYAPSNSITLLRLWAWKVQYTDAGKVPHSIALNFERFFIPLLCHSVSLTSSWVAKMQIVCSTAGIFRNLLRNHILILLTFFKVDCICSPIPSN